MLQILVLPLSAILIGLVYVASVVIYNAFFHPLRKYPGPILNRMTYMVQGYHIFKGDILSHVIKLHENYGSIVRVSPTELSFIEEQAWPEIYGHASSSDKTGNLPKDFRVQRPTVSGAASIITANTEDHRRLRRIQTHMFSEKVLLTQEPLIKTFSEKLVARLHEKASSPSTEIVNIVKWYNYTTFDVLGELAFGESFHCLESENLHPWITKMNLLIKDNSYWAASQKFPWPLNKIAYGMSPPETRASRYQLTDFAAQKVRERLSQGSTDRVDFMSHILKHNDEKGMTQQEIESNAILLIIAGSETTATFLSGVTYHLLRYPHHLNKLTDLLRTTFPSQSDINITALNKLEYLGAIISEGFRTYPPVPVGLPRYTTPGGNIICGDVVPEHTTVCAASYAAYTSEENFKDPLEFVPERWYKVGTRPERYDSDKRKVLNPFSLGPRNCIGRNLALAELKLVLAQVLWSFDLELQADCLDWLDQKCYALWDKKPLNVRLVPRKM
ncbi:Cytochrome P450 monooxygenase [Podosphaera aphanis]|nr:Cytochrome P450 monooxygenase [Podosphaera aphanis]